MAPKHGSKYEKNPIPITSLLDKNPGDSAWFALQMVKATGQWEFQDPKMEVLYHIRPYFAGIFPYIGLKNRPYIW